MSTVTTADAEKALALVAEWIGKRGYGVELPDGTIGPAPTGPEAAYKGDGPQLVMDWDWGISGPNPTILLEGGPYDWALDSCPWVQKQLDKAGVKVFVEPYSGWALSLYPSN